jgi:predicted DNA binding CopG/RHH family protein
MALTNRTTIQITEEIRQELKELAAARDISYQELLHEMINVFKDVDKEKTLVSIPNRLAKKIQDNLQKTDMYSLSEYITFTLRMALAEGLSEDESNKIREKLKKLQYL